MIDWIYEHPELSVAATALAFWWIRYLIGHKLYGLTRWNRFKRRDRWWKRIDMHDWQPDPAHDHQKLRRARCLMPKNPTSDKMLRSR